jgi:hypothetical protein
VRQQHLELGCQHPLVDFHHPGHTTRLPGSRANGKVI